MDELEQMFSIDRVSKSSGVFDIKKLNWMNAHYIREAPLEELTELAIPYLVEAGYMNESEIQDRKSWVTDLLAVIRDNLHCLSELPEKMAVFFRDEVEGQDEEATEWMETEEIRVLAAALRQRIEEMGTYDEQTIKQLFKTIQKETGLKGPAFFKPVRVAVTGRIHGPDLVLVMKVLGKETTIRRLMQFEELPRET